MDLSVGARRITKVPGGELIAAVSAVVLGIVMFFLEWYGTAGVAGQVASRAGVSNAENAWHGLTTLRWLMLLTIVVAIGSLLLRIRQRFHGTQTDLSPVVMALGSLTSVLLINRVLIDLPGAGSVVDQKGGAFLGLLCAIGIAFGGYESWRETRRSARTVVQRARR